jgi:hypothetical protein
LQLFDERLEDCGVRGRKRLGRRERFRLDRRPRMTTQAQLSVLVKREIEASVDPRCHRSYRARGVRHFPSQPLSFAACHLPKHRRNQLVLRFEMSVERAGAQLSAFQDNSNVEPSNP